MHLWARASSKLHLHLSWVKGHSESYGNNIADTLARKGSDRLETEAWWQRPFQKCDWGSTEFLQMFSLEQQDIPNEMPAHVVTADVSSLQSLASSIVQSALACGTGRRVRTVRLDAHDADVLLSRSLQQQRSAEQDPLQRQTLSLQTCRVRRRMRRRTYIMKCEAVASGRKSLRSFKRNVSHKVTHLYSEGCQVTSLAAMSGIVTTFYADLFTDPLPANLPSWIREIGDPDITTIRTSHHGTVVCFGEPCNILRQEKHALTTSWLLRCFLSWMTISWICWPARSSADA